MLKCPYCPETRPSRSRLDNHITQSHGATLDAAAATHGPDLQAAADLGNRAMVALVNEDDTPRCTCGAPVQLVTDEDGTFLVHVILGNGGCTDARLSSHEPTPKDRTDLQAEWDRVGAGLDKAGQEMREMRAALDAVDERMRKLDAELTKPSVVRRATLNQVWDKLLDAGQLEAARVVMKMIERVVD